MANRKIKITISYSDVYYRPVDTKVARAGWYVDKYTEIWHNHMDIERKVKIIPFLDKESARKFVRSHSGIKEDVK